MNENSRFYVALMSVIALLVVITIMFLWKESLSLALAVNHQKFANYFIVVGSILTAVTIGLIYLQYKSNEDSRIASSTPELIPIDIEFYTQDRDNLMGPGKDPYFFRDTNFQQAFYPYIEIQNIGFGPAKSIKCTWNYNVEDIREVIGQVYDMPEDSIFESINILFIPIGQKSVVNLPAHYLLACAESSNISEVDILLGDDNKTRKPQLTLELSFEGIHRTSATKLYSANVTGIGNRVSIHFETSI
jgi:uncharacterized membrane protein